MPGQNTMNVESESGSKALFESLPWLLNGTISFISKQGEGTGFTVEFPQNLS